MTTVPVKSSDDDEECFYRLCTKQTTCKGYVTYGKWKTRQSSIMCCLFTTMIACLLISVIIPLLINSLVDEAVNEEVVIDSTSASNYEAWQTNFGPGKDDMNVYYKLYFFDLQNPVETLAGEKPVVVERGPYVYNEYFIKFDIEWSDHGDTVTYNNQRFYVFNQEETGAGLTSQDEFTLPYPSVVTFDYLLGTLPPSVNEALTVQIYAKLAEKEAESIALINKAYVAASSIVRPGVRKDYQDQITAANTTIQNTFDRLYAFVQRSSPTKLLLKTILCEVPSGVSPFFKVKPADAWFGYLNDPVLSVVQSMINVIEAKTGQPIGWTSAMPGPATNWTSISDTRRRRNRDTYKTGKKNPKQVSQYVYYQNMTELRTCVASYNNPWANYTEGVEWPSCPYYDRSWDSDEALIEKYGYTIPWADDYANRIAGTDATMFGRPVTSDKVQVFISDIYRSAYLEHQENTYWYSVPVRRYGIQLKDLSNITVNPENDVYYSFGPSGMLNTTTAAGAPVYVSFPHFYLGDSRLVSDVVGLSPNPDLHACYLDVEPQTGLLARARKRLQVNYLMNSFPLPQVEANASEIAHNECITLNTTIYGINTNLIIDKKSDQTIPYLTCDNELGQALIQCLAVPSQWKLQNDEIFFPYGWTSEELDLSQDDADDLNELLYGTEGYGTTISFWSLIVAGLCFCVLIGMLIHYYLLYRQGEGEGYFTDHQFQQFKLQQESLLSPHEPPLVFTYSPEYTGNTTGGSNNGSGNGRTNMVVENSKGKPQDSYSFSG